jgi:hypothetical protein
MCRAAGAPGEERGAHGDLDRRQIVLHPHLRHRRALHDPVGDQVERHVDPARRRRYIVGMLIDSLLIQRVDLRDLRGPASRTDPSGDRLELVRGPSSQEHLRSLAGERLCDSAADRASASVDHRVLSLKQHQYLLIVATGSGPVSRPVSSSRSSRCCRTYRPGNSSPLHNQCSWFPAGRRC